MNRFALFRDSEGNYHVSRTKLLKNDPDNEKGYLVDDIPVSVVYFNDDKKTLEDLCSNLNSKSPRLKIIDSVRCKKPIVIENKLVKAPHLRPRQLIPYKNQIPKENHKYDTLDQSESEYEASDSETESEESDTDENRENDNTASSGVFDITQDTPEKSNSSFNVPGNSACDDKNLKTQTSKSKETKKNLCIYCKKFQTQLGRHVVTHHALEEDVKKVLVHEKNSLGRKRAIAVIRKKGNFELLVNQDLNKGESFVPVRRPVDAKKCSATNFAVCPDCKGLYTKNNLRHHNAQCPEQKNGSRGVMAMSRVAAGRIHPRASKVLRQEVIPRMTEDDVVRCIRFDLGLILYGNELCLKHRREYRHKLIRSNLRLCGRFLLFLQKNDPKIIDFATLYNPAYYHFLINAIDEFAGLNKRTGHYQTAGNATEITKHIKNIGELLKSEYIIIKNVEKQTNVDNFLTLCKSGFSNVINKTAMETLVARQREKIVELPLSNDILLLSEYLDELIDKHYENLRNEFSYYSWRKLAEAVLSRIQVFNRRRAGESERVLLSDMKSLRSIKEDDEEFLTMTTDEKKSAQEYVRIVIRGKLNSNVPILLTKRWYKAIKLIVKHRQDAGVSKQNPYVFGIDGLSDQSYLSATKLLNDFSKKCGAAKPNLLRGTPLRKHAATKCAQFGLDDTNTAHFAKFMGHDINIHKNIYQQPVLKKDIVNISKVLEKAQKPSASTVTSGALTIDTNLDRHGSTFDNKDDTCANEFQPEESLDTTTNHDMTANSSTDNDVIDSTQQDHSTFTNQKQSNTCNAISPPISRLPWSKEEVKDVKYHFKDFLKSKTLPPLPMIRNIQHKFKVLQNRKPVVIKAYINNQNIKNNASSKSDYVKTNVTNDLEDRIKRHLKFTFKEYIKKRLVPALDVCSTAKMSDKVLRTLSDTNIQHRVRKLFKN